MHHTLYIGGSDVGFPIWRPTEGAIANISNNLRSDIDPRYDPLANPNYPSTAPWETGGVEWIHVTDFCGALLSEDIGAHGTYMQYGGSGHSAIGANFWFGFDLSDQVWKRVGKRPLPSDAFNAAINPFNLSLNYPAAQLDATWGEWQGDWTGWPNGFAQPGYNPPEGSHTRNSFVVRPAVKAGNAGGQLLCCWQPTGKQSGTELRGGFIWNADTSLFSRQTTLRPSAGSTVGGVQYFVDLDAVVGLNMESSATATYVDVLDCVTMAWSRRTTTNAPMLYYDSTSFAHPVGNLLIVANNKLTAQTPPIEFWAIDASNIKSGAASAWSQLTISASSYPIDGTNICATVAWARCPLNGCYYAVNRVHGSTMLWKLTPPAGNTIESQLSGTWVITTEALSGVSLDGRRASGVAGTSFDYNRLQWSNYAKCFIWTPDYVGGNVQAIRPQGI